MMTVKTEVEPHVAEYIRGKFFDHEAKAVRFPPALDIYILIYDLLQKRPVACPVDTGNLEFVLPERRMGKDPITFNYLSGRAQKILADKMRLMMWAELHDLMDENKHINGIQFKESVFMFMRKYAIESITEDALLKNYQRWRDKQRRKKKRGYTRK
ncbi:hypothetical protein [uncultured Bacteroides sp.]|uniref:hypothetical protein n=1 Tax=uncultured Bacteroides sp. TaxID=162156 RepID=UPI0026701124|nr:hypothetical protein [uncultured Bacteroides sp.]